MAGWRGSFESLSRCCSLSGRYSCQVRPTIVVTWGSSTLPGKTSRTLWPSFSSVGFRTCTVLVWTWFQQKTYWPALRCPPQSCMCAIWFPSSWAALSCRCCCIGSHHHQLLWSSSFCLRLVQFLLRSQTFSPLSWQDFVLCHWRTALMEWFCFPWRHFTAR